MQIGCPAISFKDKKAVIDPTLCIGCEVCHRCVNSAHWLQVKEGRFNMTKNIMIVGVGGKGPSCQQDVRTYAITAGI